MYIKTKFYDDFHCIADQCSFTCCKGWDITVDEASCDKWQKDKQHSDYLSPNMKKSGKDKKTYINMGKQKICPFFSQSGLCNIVITCGEDYQSKTCKIFPRLDSGMGDVDGYSLSCACPEVVDMINSIDGRIQFHYDIDETGFTAVPPEYRIRQTMILIMQNAKHSLKDRLLTVFYMLLRIREAGLNSIECLDDYVDEQYLESIIGCWSGGDIPYSDSLQETNELFLDIIQNYRKEKHYKAYLQDIYDCAMELTADDSQVLTEWSEFHQELEGYDKLFENCIVNKIFSSCTSEYIDEMIVSFQMLITEYFMIGHSLFLKYLVKSDDQSKIQSDKNFGTSGQADTIHEISDRISYQDIRDYIVIYSRIIGYNSDGMREFWEESFDEAVWELGYLMLLLH